MKLNPKNLQNLIRKASLNHKLVAVHLQCDGENVFTTARDFYENTAVIIKKKNDIFKGVKKGFSFNFEVNRGKSFKGFHKINDYVDFKSDDKKLVFKNGNLKLTLPNYKFKYNEWPNRDKSELLGEFEIIPKEYKNIFISTNRVARRGINNFIFQNDNGKFELKLFYDTPDDKECRLIEIDNQTEIKENKNGNLYYDWSKFSNLVKLTNFKCKVEITSNGLYITSEDGSETYKLYPNEKSPMIESVDEVNFLPETDIPLEIDNDAPSVPETWNYKESVEKVRGFIFKWKNLTKEVLEELYKAREILALKPREAAQVMHGTFVPGRMTWSDYCNDIGVSRQVVDRWLKRAFKKDGTLIEEPEKIKETKETDKPTHYPADGYLESVKKFLDGNNGFIDLYNTKKAKEKIQNLNGDAIVYVNPKYIKREWFEPLHNGVFCFDEKGCSVYTGKKRKTFIKEFEKHGICMVKAE
jgi:hypothetical protein